MSMGAAFPQRVSAEASAVPRWRKPARVAINPPEFHLHEADGPIAAFGFGESHHLPLHRFLTNTSSPFHLICPFGFTRRT